MQNLNSQIEMNEEVESVIKYLIQKIKEVFKNCYENQYKRVCDLEKILNAWLDLDLAKVVELDINYSKLPSEDLKDKFLTKYISEKLYSLNV